MRRGLARGPRAVRHCPHALERYSNSRVPVPPVRGDSAPAQKDWREYPSIERDWSDSTEWNHEDRGATPAVSDERPQRIGAQQFRAEPCCEALPGYSLS